MSYRFQTSISTLCKNKVYCLYYVINVARSSIQKQLFGGMWAFKQTMMIQSNSLIFRHNCFFKNSKSPIIYLPTRKDVSAYKVRSFSRMSRRSHRRDSVYSPGMPIAMSPTSLKLKKKQKGIVVYHASQRGMATINHQHMAIITFFLVILLLLLQGCYALSRTALKFFHK